MYSTHIDIDIKSAGQRSSPARPGQLECACCLVTQSPPPLRSGYARQAGTRDRTLSPANISATLSYIVCRSPVCLLPISVLWQSRNCCFTYLPW